ncbi:MAG: hypothetical protein AB7K09_23645 [Planctomycetota bacterium]
MPTPRYRACATLAASAPLLAMLIGLVAACSSPPPPTPGNGNTATTSANRTRVTGLDGTIETNSGLPPPIDIHNLPTNTGEGVINTGPRRQMVFDGAGSDEPVIIYNEAADKLPMLFAGMREALERYRFRTIEIPAVRILAPRIDDRGRTWIRAELLANRGPLIDAIGDWMRAAVMHLATTDSLATVTENRLIDDLASRLDISTMGEAEGREIGRLASAQAVVLIELEPQFGAQRPINLYGSRYLVQAEYRATARMVDVERGVSVWFNSIAWSRAFEVTSR